MPVNHSEGEVTDEQLRVRTELLLKAAEHVSIQLQLQTAQLQESIELFDREVLKPLREGLKPDEQS